MLLSLLELKRQLCHLSQDSQQVSVEFCEGRWMNHAGITSLSLCFVSIKCAYIHSAWIRYIQRNKKPLADAIGRVKRNLTCTSDFNPPLLPIWLILLERWMGVGLYRRSLHKMSNQTSLLFADMSDVNISKSRAKNTRGRVIVEFRIFERWSPSICDAVLDSK